MKGNIFAQHSDGVSPNAYINGLIAFDSGDYGGGFATYSPPSVDADFDIRVVQDTNATTPGKRLYIYAGGAWHYVDLV